MSTTKLLLRVPKASGAVRIGFPLLIAFKKPKNSDRKGVETSGLFRGAWGLGLFRGPMPSQFCKLFEMISSARPLCLSLNRSLVCSHGTGPLATIFLQVSHRGDQGAQFSQIHAFHSRNLHIIDSARKMLLGKAEELRARHPSVTQIACADILFAPPVPVPRTFS